MAKKKVLILGGDARAHALAWRLWREGHEIHAAPGNPGIQRFGTCVPIDPMEFEKLAEYVESNGIDLTVVGPEAPLAAGIVDFFSERHLAIVGPTQAAARIETSKGWCSELLASAGVPIPTTWKYPDFTAMEEAAWRKQCPMVTKMDGLAAGKGVEVVRTEAELPKALTRLKQLDQGGRFLIQQMVTGPELSFFVVTDGEDYQFLGSAQDYKPLYPGGPNTGGMGGFSPHPVLTPALQAEIERTIVAPTIAALAADGCPFRGFLYFQLMLTERGPVVIEINCRFGDPEAELIMPRLDCKLFPLLLAATGHGPALAECEVKFRPEVSVGLVLASEGYPDKPLVGRPITLLPYDPALGVDSYLFHAGTKWGTNGQLETSGGRVMTAVGLGTDYTVAKRAALELIEAVRFNGRHYRTDIADEVIAG